MYNIFFFFSSRRRHTRLQGDWSSDVCSSDLHGSLALKIRTTVYFFSLQLKTERRESKLAKARSEERRVGKECRSRRSPYHEKKKIRQIKETVRVEGEGV